MNAPFKMPNLYPDRDRYLKLVPHRFGEGEGFEQIVSTLLREVRALPGFDKGNRQKQEVAMRVIASNLVHINDLSPEPPLTVKRGNGDYKSNRYNPYSIGIASLRWVINGLHACGYIRYQQGNHGSETVMFMGHAWENKGNLSRVWVADKLTQLIGRMHNHGIRTDTKARELVVLKKPKEEGKDHADLDDYTDTDFTNNSRAILENHNALLARTEITLSGHTCEQVLHVGNRTYDLTDKTTYRSFSNSSFEQGGRIYGGFWEQIPNNDKDGEVRGYRKKILINGNKTVELDFSSLHLTMAYSREKIDPLTVFEQEDLYELPGYERTVVKTSWNVSLSCHRRDNGLGAIRKELKKMGVEKTTEELSDLVDAFQAKHPKVAKYMFKNWGLKLQFQDSEMMIIIIQRFDELGIPVLTVHDSIIVEEKHEELGLRIMQESYNEAGFIGTPLIRKE